MRLPSLEAVQADEQASRFENRALPHLVGAPFSERRWFDQRWVIHAAELYDTDHPTADFEADARVALSTYGRKRLCCSRFEMFRTVSGPEISHATAINPRT